MEDQVANQGTEVMDSTQPEPQANAETGTATAAGPTAENVGEAESPGEAAGAESGTEAESSTSFAESAELLEPETIHPDIPLFNQTESKKTAKRIFHRQAPETPSAKIRPENESVQRAKFPLLQEEATQVPLSKIDYLKDVDLEASVELGNAVLTVEKILGLNVGSIIELNQSVGDQISLLINGNPYATGEVVVIGDKFGVRISKIMHD